LHSDCTAITQGGGEHRIFEADPDMTYPGSLGKGLDLKHHGYICVAPTLGPSGAYRWESGRSPLSQSRPAMPSPLPSLIAGKGRIPVEYSAEQRGGVPVATAQTFDDLRSALKYVDADDYTTWVNVGMVLKPYGENGYKIWTEWSATSDKFDAVAQRRKWERDIDRPHSITYRSIFRMAIDNGWAGNDSAPPTDAGSKSTSGPADYDDKQGNPLLRPIRAFSDEETKNARLTPRVLVEGYLYADLRNFIAAGGVGKTTVLLYEAICGALGIPIWDNTVPEPFTTVFITKEDPREIFAARLAAIMNEMDLQPDQRQQVYRRVFVVDLSGTSQKLACRIEQRISPDEQILQTIISHCGPVKPDRVVFDPLVSFTFGESHVNEAEQAVVEAARYLMRKMPGTAVDIVHHTGKSNGRLGTLDQYSGRNGSALPDGCRMVAVMVGCTAETILEETGYILDPAETGLRIRYAKMSYGRPPEDLFLIRRGFAFKSITRLGPGTRAMLRQDQKDAEARKSLEATKKSVVHAIHLSQASPDPVDRYPSCSRVIELPGVTGKKVTRKKALDELLFAGVLVERELGDLVAEFNDKRELGGRKTYIALISESD
jgi:RecA-family ATPase